jgi:2-hydroxy-3-oxopropionate reductase
MARRLADEFGEIAVWNRDPAKLDGMDLAGLRVFEDTKEAVEDADVVVTMLTDGSAVADVLFDRGVASAMRRGSILIDMSSIAPWEALDHCRRLDEQGISQLDAPVSGGTVGAESGRLAIMVGGEQAVFERVLPVLRVLGRPTYLGPAGAGQIAKLANQVIVGLTIGAVSEGIALARSGGLDLHAFVEAIQGGLAGSAILEQLAPRMIAGDFSVRGRSSTHLKDIRNTLKYAAERHLPLELTKRLETAFASVIDRYGDLDHSALILNVQPATEREVRK